MFYTYLLSYNIFLLMKELNSSQITALIDETKKPDKYIHRINRNNLKKYNNIFKEELTNFIEYLQNNLMNKISNDYILYLMIGYFINRKFNDIYMENGFYEIYDNYGDIWGEVIYQLDNNMEYLPIFIDLLGEKFPIEMKELFIPLHKNNILKKIQKEDFIKGIEIIYDKYRNCLLFSILTYILKEKIERPDLIEILVNYFHRLGKYSRIEYFNEIYSYIEESLIDYNLFEKLINLKLDKNDIFYLENYTKECHRLINEFQRILNHSSLKEESKIFYYNEIERLTKISYLTSNIKQKIIILDKIRQINAANTIKNAWYNYITKICHPDHPFIQDRFKKLYQKIDSKTY